MTYNTDSYPHLVSTIQKLISASKQTYVLVAYKERSEAERGLWGMLKEIGVELLRVDEVPGAGGAPVEIWLAKCLCKSRDNGE